LNQEISKVNLANTYYLIVPSLIMLVAPVIFGFRRLLKKIREKKQLSKQQREMSKLN
jgi:hypothetical protein